MKFFLFGLIVVLGIWLMVNILTTLLQDWFIFIPTRLDPAYEYKFAGPYCEIDLDAAQSGRLNVLWFKQDLKKPSEKVIVYYHGNAGSLARWAGLHRYFFDLGYDFLIYDYRGFGKSRGRRSERLMYDDALRLFDFALEHYSSPQITIYGRSLGATFACKAAADRPACRLILETPFTSMKDLFYLYYPFLPRVFFFKYHFNNMDLLSRVNIPVHIFHGDRDWVTPYAGAAKLKAKLKPGDTFTKIAHGSHHDLHFFEAYHEEIKKILQ